MQWHLRCSLKARLRSSFFFFFNYHQVTVMGTGIVVCVCVAASVCFVFHRSLICLILTQEPQDTKTVQEAGMPAMSHMCLHPYRLLYHVTRVHRATGATQFYVACCFHSSIASNTRRSSQLICRGSKPKTRRYAWKVTSRMG